MPADARIIDDPVLAGLTGLLLDRLIPPINGATALGRRRYPDDPEALRHWAHGALYGIAASYMHDHAGDDEDAQQGSEVLFVSLCEILEEIHNDENRGDIDKALLGLVPDALGEEG